MIHTTYCRICHASCGLRVEVSDGRVIRVKADEANPGSRGFTCPKGRRIAEYHYHPDRLRTSMKRTEDGTFVTVDADTAIREIADRLSDLRDDYGPDAIAIFFGTQGYLAAPTFPVALAWWKALGSHKAFTTATVDQIAKVVTMARMGQYLGGPQAFHTADVWLLAGTNPPVSMQVLGGFPTHDPIARIREAKEGGLKLIVVDPRRTETASFADLHLQLIPGTDALLFAALINVVFEEGLDDEGFWSRYANGVDELRELVRPITPDRAARSCGLTADEIVAAAVMFGRGPRGIASGGTGTDMGPYGDLTEHLITALNVICGRFLREGEEAADTSVLSAARPRRAEVLAPNRMWETSWKSPLGFGLIPSRVGGELPSTMLCEEILQPGRDRVRALIVVSGNPASALPDQDRVVEALSSLDLLVTTDPWMSETARLAHYIFAPSLPLERPDHTGLVEAAFSLPLAQYTPPVIERPLGVIDDWELYWGLATRMGMSLSLGSAKLDHEGAANRGGAPAPTAAVDMARKPTTDELLEWLVAGAPVPLATVKAHPHGLLAELPPLVVEPPSHEARETRLQLVPDDVAAEFVDVTVAAAASAHEQFPFRLVVRRTKETFNSTGRQIDRLVRWGVNPVFLHPDDARDLGAATGDTVGIESQHDRIEARVELDATLRRGVVSMTHGWGGLPSDDHAQRGVGSNPGRLIGCADPVQAYTNMPRLTAVPVKIATTSTRSG